MKIHATRSIFIISTIGINITFAEFTRFRRLNRWGAVRLTTKNPPVRFASCRWVFAYTYPMKAEIAERVLERAGNYCEKCGRPGHDFALHHRKLKSQGGRDEISNLIAVHHECHNMGTRAIHMNPKESVENGWIVPGWADPTTYPLVLPDGTHVLLDNEGSYTQTEGKIHGTD